MSAAVPDAGERLMHERGRPHRRLSRLFAQALLVAMAFPFGAPAGLAAPAGSQSTQTQVEGLFISLQLGLDPPQGLLVDAWYRLELLGKPVGYMRTAMRRRGDCIETLEYTLIQVARGPVTIKVIARNVTMETLDGRPLEIHSQHVFASQPVRYDAKFQPDGSIDLEITQNDNKVTRRLPADPAATFPWRMVRDILAGKRAPGESFVECGYEFVSGTKPIRVEHEAAGETLLRLPDGREVHTFLYKVTEPAMGGKVEVYCEPRILMPVRFEIPVMAMRFTATLATKEQATALEGKPAPEMFVRTMLKAKVAGSLDPTQAPSVLYTIQLTEDEPVDLPSTDMQRALRSEDRRVRLVVSRRKAGDRPSEATRPAGPPSGDLERYLGATTYCNIDDEAVRKLAAEGAADEADPQRLVEKLCQYVHRKMTHKGLDVALATASEVARTLQGDCTEHAVLLAALARANGLPSRGVFGMVALPGSFEKGTLTFGYHMWTQVCVAGRWIDVDAALNQPVPDATHIAMGVCDFADTTLPTDSLQTFMRLAGKMEITAEPAATGLGIGN
jgi:transglutaminase-like putative cysteine protease